MQDSTQAISPPPPIDAVGTGQTKQGTTLWQRIALGLIVLLATFLNLFRLGQNNFVDIHTSVNSYYAAAVKSMLMNWHNFFFAAFDPAGFLAIDKPPLGFWVQVASARLFGFSERSLLLPEALAGIGSVVVLYVLVRRVFGPLAGLLAALALALMPISVVASRNNTIDSLLILTLLFAAWALSIAAETGRLRWLLLSVCLVGLGFNIKMLEAYVILPAFVMTYLLCAPRRLSIRCAHLALAILVLIVVSFSWITVVDLTPAAQRPYVSSTQTDSELELAIGYNGISRITSIGSSGLTQRSSAQRTQSTGPALNATGALLIFGIAATGLPGPLRLISPLLGGQIGWLLLFAIFGLIAVWRWKLPRRPLTPRQPGLVLWGTWFIVLLVFFSLALFDHAYYMVTFAPAICALVGIGGVEMYQRYRARAGWRSWLLPIALIATALIEAHILAVFPAWNARLTPLVVGLSVLIAVLLIVVRVQPRLARPKLAGSLVTSGIVVLLIAPTVWAALPTWAGNDTINPVAGPAQPVSALAIIAHAFIPEISHGQPELTHYLLAHQGQARYLVATVNASTAASFILDTSKPAMALGGFNGFDQIETPQQIATLVQQGVVRFFLLPSLTQLSASNFSPGTRQIFQTILQRYSSGGVIFQVAISQWVTTHCTLVTRAVAEPGTTGSNATVDLGSRYTLPTQLFDCANASS